MYVCMYVNVCMYGACRIYHCVCRGGRGVRVRVGVVAFDVQIAQSSGELLLRFDDCEGEHDLARVKRCRIGPAEELQKLLR